VALEALENIIRHAHASRATLSLMLLENLLVLQITDDGVGFALNAVDVDAHFGLLGLRERAELHDADFEVRSRPGEGAEISYRVEISQ
jgi:signal transduction histidine kinase